MPLFSSAKWIAIAIALLSILGALWYISNLKADLAISEANVVKLEQSIKDQQAVIDTKIKEIQAIQNINNDLSTTISTQQKQIRDLNEKFDIAANGQSRDFGAITRVKPVLVNNIINRATVNANRCFELATGATPKEGEVNNECKDIINTYSK